MLPRRGRSVAVTEQRRALGTLPYWVMSAVRKISGRGRLDDQRPLLTPFRTSAI